MVRVAITRGENELSSLAKSMASDGIEIIPWPLISTHAKQFEWPHDLNPEAIDWLVFSSRNGVRFFLDRLNELNISIQEKTRIAAVGKKTALALEDHSLRVNFVPETNTGEALFNQLVTTQVAEGETVVWARAAKVIFDPSLLMSKNAINYFPIVCYETTPVPLESKIVNEVCEKDSALFTSPSAVESFQQQYGQPGVKLIAIGRTTEAAMKRAGWSDITVMKEPDLNMIAEYV